MILSSRKAITCLAAVLMLTPVLFAEVTGGIQGTVTDPSGATVPNATVTLKNPETGLDRRVQTDGSGTYQFLSVPVGDQYNLQVEAQGFRTSVQNGIKLLVNQNYRADFKLVVGAVSQTIDVSTSTTQVDTSSTQLGDVIESKKMTGLPLNGRSYIDLLGLQTGVIPVSSDSSQYDRFVSGNQTTGQVSVNGQRETSNSFMVNGGDVEESVQNGASIVPTLDSIEEFRLLTDSFNAEYGRFSGAIVNVVTKSGTNDIHGSAYEFLRNEKLDARSYFDQDRGVFKRNQFGGTIGAPIVKNKMFFFGDYQGTREIRGLSSGVINTPSLLERTGDFSDLATTGYAPFTGSVRGDSSPTNFAATLTQRLGYSVTPGEQYWFSGCTTSAQCVFPGAAGPVIPQAAWSPVAVKTLQFIPTPNGVTDGTPNFSTSAEKSNVKDDKFGIKIDLNKFGNWSFYYHFDDSSFLNPYPAFTSNVPGFSAVTDSRGQLFGLSHTSIINSTTVNELHLNYTRFAFLKNKPVGGLGKVTDFGYVEGGLGINPVNPDTEGVAPIGLDQLGLNFGLPDGTTGQYNNTYQITDGFSKVAGKHTLKFGGDVRYIQVNERNTYTSNGWFLFDGGETGNDFADYLLGAPDLFNQTSHQLLDSRTKYFALYAQDAFKARSDLTINYGLRWDVSQPFYDTQDRIQTFVPGVQSKIYPDSPRGFVFPGDPGIPRTLAPTQYNRFAPRLGIAYSPSATDGLAGKIFGGPGKTSIRVGGGLYFTAIQDESLFVEVGDAPFGLFYVSPVPVYLEEPYKNRTTPPSPVGNRFPFTIPPKGATGIWPIYLPVSGSPTFKPSNKLPYAEHLNFTIQREIGKTGVLSVGYVGSWGRHLFSQIEANPGSASKCLAVAPPLIPSGQECGPFGEDQIYNLTDGTTVNGTRPYSVTSGRELANGQLDFSSNSWEATVANSSYHSLQTSMEKKVGDLRFLAAYTWSKSLDNSSGFSDPINPFNPNNSRALSQFDITHNFVFSYGYDLPFFKTAHGVTGKLLGGWNISGITRFATGFPVTLTESDDASLCGCNGADVPNYDGSSIHFLNPRGPGNQLFDPSPFSPETIGVLGTSNRRFFHGPGFNNWDFALHKNTMIGERMALEFRAEFFNIFNHAQFTNPSGDINGSNFGVVTNARDPRIGQFALKFSF
ncbi:MAG: carboxypeptidase regulatory-like domain-containing protein [Terriglobales bacterium]